MHDVIRFEHDQIWLEMEALPFKDNAHDAMRLGLSSLREDATPLHPVETIQRMDASGDSKQKQYQMMKQLYGIAAPAKVI